MAQTVIGFGAGCFLGTSPTVDVSTTLTTTNNWMTVGPTTVNTGITVTINTGATWVIV
jgi:hypothetical protein